ncbi:MAG: WG repeat-containing protein, partial [Acidobacteriota bacterium]|nr:WG repeat-containing protein [Acidobacteriota bacterium]
MFEQSGEFREGLAAVCIDSKWSCVDHEGSWVIKPQFIAAYDFWHGLARVAWKDGREYVDLAGAT